MQSTALLELCVYIEGTTVAKGNWLLVAIFSLVIPELMVKIFMYSTSTSPNKGVCIVSQCKVFVWIVVSVIVFVKSK